MKVTVKPIKEIEITTLFKTDLDILIKRQAIGDSPKLFWCNGIMFIAYGYSDNKIESKTLENQIEYYAEVNYAECPEFQECAKWNGYSIEILNSTGHPEYETLTKFLGDLK